MRITLEVQPPDEELMRLNREATAAKKAKDWTRAVECLRQTVAKTGETSSLRLALFLQQAGRFDEAMTEFNQLIEDARPRAEREFSHLGPYGKRAVVASELMRIYDKMRLACQRQKLPDQVERYAKLYDQQHSILQKLRPLAQAEKKKKFAEYWERMDK